jgi:hypothetical protein
MENRMRVIFYQKSRPYLLALRNKLPPFDEISRLYATIVFLVYGWTSLAFFWKVPSWRYFLDLGEIVSILAYALSSTLFESVIILLLFVLASLVLPASWLRNKFVVRSSIVFYSLTFWVVLLTLSSLIQLPTTNDVLTLVLGFPLTAGLGMILVDKMPFLHRFMDYLSNQLTIFLYLWLPLSLAGILILIIRNIG